MCKSKEERSLSKEEKMEALEQMLQTRFPLRPMIILSTIGILASFIAIAFQIVAIIEDVKLGYIAAGIWTGAVVLLRDVVSISLIITRQVLVYRLLQIMRVITFFCVLAFIIITSIAYSNSHPGDQGYAYQWVLHGLISLGTIMKINNLIGALVFFIRQKRQYKIYAQQKSTPAQFRNNI